MQMKTRIAQIKAIAIFLITAPVMMGCFPNAGTVAEPIQQDQKDAKQKQQQPQTAQQPQAPHVQVNEHDAIARVLQERSETSFPAIPSKTSGIIHVAMPGSSRDIKAQVQTQVMQKAEHNDVVILTEWWSSKDFPKMVRQADGKMKTINSDQVETLSHTWKYEVTADETKLVADEGDYPPEYIN